MSKPPLSATKKLGLPLLGLTLLCWVAFPFLPFLEIPHKAAVITAAVIGGEVLFVLAVALLGKEYWGQIKHGFKQAWNKTRRKNGQYR